MARKRTTALRIRRGGWRQWTAAEARLELKAWKASGLLLGTFARRRGLNGTRLRWWVKRLGDWDGDPLPAQALAFVPAVVREAPEGEAASSTTPVTVRFPGGVVVEVANPASVSSEWLTALVSGMSRAG